MLYGHNCSYVIILEEAFWEYCEYCLHLTYIKHRVNMVWSHNRWIDQPQIQLGNCEHSRPRQIQKMLENFWKLTIQTNQPLIDP